MGGKRVKEKACLEKKTEKRKKKVVLGGGGGWRGQS